MDIGIGDMDEPLFDMDDKDMGIGDPDIVLDYQPAV